MRRRGAGLPLEPGIEPRRSDAPDQGEWSAGRLERQREVAPGDAHGAVEVWLDVIDVERDRVRFNTHYRFERDGDEIVSSSELRFRTQDELAALLESAGFSHLSWQGDWNGAPVSASSRELIVVAR